MKFLNFLNKKSRSELIKEKSEAIFYSVTEDLSNFSDIEQANIIKAANILFIKRFSDEYNKAYESQKNVLIAKDILK